MWWRRQVDVLALRHMCLVAAKAATDGIVEVDVGTSTVPLLSVIARPAETATWRLLIFYRGGGFPDAAVSFPGSWGGPTVACYFGVLTY